MAQRDMTRREFQTALARNGFKGPAFYWFEDTTGQAPGVHWSGIFTRSGDLLRRETLARLIKAREKEVARRRPKPMARAA